MKKLIFIFALLIISAVKTFAQAPDILWTKIIGDSLEQRARSIIQTPDGRFIIVGRNDDALYIIKTDSYGDTIYTKSYYDPNLLIEASFIEKTKDSCYIITGAWLSRYTSGVILTKINALGDTLWFNWDLGYAFGTEAKETSDGGYIVSEIHNPAGKNPYPGILVKTDSAGNESWWRAFYGAGVNSVVQVEDGGFIFTGGHRSGGISYTCLMKTNSIGDSLWCKLYELPDSCYCYGFNNKVIKTSDGGFIILVADFSYWGQSLGDLWLLKTDEFGDTLWTKKYGGTECDEGLSIQQTNDDGYIITGFTTTIWGDKDVWILRTDSFGNTLWTKTLGGNGDEVGWSVRQTSDGGYIICGDKNQSIGRGDTDVWLIRLAPDTLTKVKNGNEIVNDYHLYQNYPNPFNPITTINYQIPKSGFVILKVYDVLGKEVATLVNKKQSAGRYEVNWDGSSYPSGVYFYKLVAEHYTNMKKMLLVK